MFFWKFWKFSFLVTFVIFSLFWTLLVDTPDWQCPNTLVCNFGLCWSGVLTNKVQVCPLYHWIPASGLQFDHVTSTYVCACDFVGWLPNRQTHNHICMCLWGAGCVVVQGSFLFFSFFFDCFFSLLFVLFFNCWVVRVCVCIGVAPRGATPLFGPLTRKPNLPGKWTRPGLWPRRTCGPATARPRASQNSLPARL